MPVQNDKQMTLSWVQFTMLMCGFWLIVLVGNTRNPLANYAAVSAYDVKSVDLTAQLIMQLLAGPFAGAFACVLLVSVVGGRHLWQALMQPISMRGWWWLVPVSLGIGVLRWGLMVLADQLPWTWVTGTVISDLQWWDQRMLWVIALRELFTVIATLLMLMTIDVGLSERLQPSRHWVMYLLLGLVAAGLATTSAQPAFLRQLLVVGIPAIGAMFVFHRWRNLWFVLLGYELVFRVITVVFVLATW
ncbi:hypothetical protein [Lacticaseibacillus porcinae]|uniref:hypothetical protein n=1 Tax=Lacticaseibacillus porcinae TaxID=1123687 RepID=UPI000F78B6E3|nr:hypothetical protein [Lacticaseibacillus porcinae]